jgi:hypothetical protein
VNAKAVTGGWAAAIGPGQTIATAKMAAHATHALRDKPPELPRAIGCLPSFSRTRFFLV